MSEIWVRTNLNIKRFDDENSFNNGQLNLFTNEETLGRTYEQAVRLLMTLVDQMEVEKERDRVALSQKQLDFSGLMRQKYIL